MYRNSTYLYVVMLVVSSKEFRDNQKNYLDKIDEGIEILLHRGKNKAYRIIPVTEDDTTEILEIPAMSDSLTNDIEEVIEIPKESQKDKRKEEGGGLEINND